MIAVFVVAVACLAQQNGAPQQKGEKQAAAQSQEDAWKTVREFPNLDWHNLTGARKEAALNFLRTDKCACGCTMKLAECRMKDPNCSMSRKLTNAAVKGFIENESVAQIRLDLKKLAAEAPPPFEDPVKLSIDGDPVVGPANARVTIVEFSDFQCPYCMKAVAQAKELLKRNPADVRLVFKQFPLDSHNQAQFAAEAALAAHAQGKFWPMHDLLYGGFPDLSRPTILRYARQIGLNEKQFVADLDSHKFAKRVQSEEKEGEVAGVDGTPSFFVNGRKYNGLFEVAVLEPLLKQFR